MNESFDPATETIADWVESVARRMHEIGARPEAWAVLYDEVAVHLRSEPSALFGKRFLLSATGALIAAQPTAEGGGRRRAPHIYFPPGGTQDSEEDSDSSDRASLPLEKLPASLKRGFAFLSREVPWLDKEGGYRPARAFFLEAKLVREYDTREVLRTLAAITRSAVADSTKETAVEWAFRLWSSGRSLSDKETRGAHFALPTTSGWRSSEEVMFGAGWSAPNGKLLEKLLKLGSDICVELASAKECVLLAYKEWPVGFGAEEDWVSFLHAAGARDCLRPIGGERGIQRDANGYWMATAILDVAMPDEETKLVWQRRLAERASRIRNPNTAYRCELHPWRLPGQGGSLSFPDTSLRRDYASQVLKAIPHLEREHLSFRIYRPGRYGSDTNEEYWPTPLEAFIAKASWMPVQRPGSDIRFVPPCDAWLSSLDFDPRPPRFVDLVSPSVVRSSDEGIAWLLDNAELGVLDDPKHAARAIRIYSEVANDKLTEDGDVRRFRELFAHAWNSAIDEGAHLELDWIPVRVGDRIEALSSGDLDEEQKTATAAYFVDEDDDAKKQLLAELEERVFDFDVTNKERTWELLTKMAPGRFRRMSEQPLEVHVDDCRFEPSPETPLLRDVFGGWITDFLVCAAEHKGGSFFVRTQKTLSKLKHTAEVLRFALGHKLQINMDGMAKDLPSSIRGAVVLRHGSITTLVVEATDGKPNLDLLARIAEQLAIALNQKGLANGFEAALLRLATRHGNDATKPTDEDMAEALGVEVDDLEQTRRYAQSDLSSHVRFAQPLAAYLGLAQSVDFLKRLSVEDDLTEDCVWETLKPISDALGIPDRQLVERLGLVSEIRELKDIFALDLPRLNAALRSLGGRFQPINNKDLHVRLFRAYLANHNARIIERIRAGFIDKFDNVQDLSRYVQLRAATDTIEADSEWFDVYDELPEEVMAQRIETWLLSQDMLTASISDELPALSECREKNGRALMEFSKRYAPVVSAWVRLSPDGITDALRELWLDPEVSKLAIIQNAQADGWIDFRLLDDVRISKWLEHCGLWPPGKPASVALTDWGLLEDAFTRGQKDAERDREARRKERREIVFAGQKVSALKNDYQALLDAVKVRASEAVGLLDIDASFRSLVDVQEPTDGGSRTGGASGSRGWKSVDSSMSDEQKEAVGFIGERWAFEWIKTFHQKRHSKQLDDNCWVSGYRNIVLGGTTGRDDLGYDFEVQLSSTTYYYEVKASTGNPLFFEMGPTEIGAALRYKADGDNKYRILYIAYATDPQRVEATILLNPFSKEGEKKFRAVGRGSVKYEFDVSDDDQ